MGADQGKLAPPKVAFWTPDSTHMQPLGPDVHGDYQEAACIFIRHVPPLQLDPMLDWAGCPTIVGMRKGSCHAMRGKGCPVASHVTSRRLRKGSFPSRARRGIAGWRRSALKRGAVGGGGEAALGPSGRTALIGVPPPLPFWRFAHDYWADDATQDRQVFKQLLLLEDFVLVDLMML